MARVICHAYGTGIFHGVIFREEQVDGRYVGVAVVEDKEVLDKFRHHPSFTVIEPEPEPKAKSKKGK